MKSIESRSPRVAVTGNCTAECRLQMGNEFIRQRDRPPARHARRFRNFRHKRNQVPIPSQHSFRDSHVLPQQAHIQTARTALLPSLYTSPSAVAFACRQAPLTLHLRSHRACANTSFGRFPGGTLSPYGWPIYVQCPTV